MTTIITGTPGWESQIKTKGNTAMENRYTLRSRYIFLTPEDEVAFLNKHPEYRGPFNDKKHPAGAPERNNHTKPNYTKK